MEKLETWKLQLWNANGTTLSYLLSSRSSWVVLRKALSSRPLNDETAILSISQNKHSLTGITFWVRTQKMGKSALNSFKDHMLCPPQTEQHTVASRYNNQTCTWRRGEWTIHVHVSFTSYSLSTRPWYYWKSKTLISTSTFDKTTLLPRLQMTVLSLSHVVGRQSPPEWYAWCVSSKTEQTNRTTNGITFIHPAQ